MAILERAVQETSESVAMAAPLHNQAGMGRVVGYGAGGHPIVRRGWKTVEQVCAELKAKYPNPIPDQLSSIDIIRQDRDSR